MIDSLAHGSTDDGVSLTSVPTIITGIESWWAWRSDRDYLFLGSQSCTKVAAKEYEIS